MNILGEGKYLQLVVEGRWEFAQRKGARGAVVIAAVTDDLHLLLVEQHRPAMGGPVLELPAGLVGDEADADEELETAARRELLEETGYEAAEMQQVAHGPPSAGLANEVATIFVARGLKGVHSGGGDESEQIVVHHAPLDRIDAWLQEQASLGKHIDPKIFAGLYFCRPLAK